MASKNNPTRSGKLLPEPIPLSPMHPIKNGATMDFSIIFPSRERSRLLVNLVNSIKETALDINNVEVLVGIDDDDAESIDAARHITAQHKFVHFHQRHRSSMLNEDYINWMARDYSVGRYLIIGNDDIEFKTMHWDEIARNKLNVYLADKPDRIVYGWLSDALINRQGMQFCCFPLVSREGMETLGFAIPGEFPSWSADGSLWEIYMRTGRILDLSEIMLEHISYHSGKRERDSVSYHVEKINSGIPISGIPIEEYAAKLNKRIYDHNRTS